MTRPQDWGARPTLEIVPDGATGACFLCGGWLYDGDEVAYQHEDGRVICPPCGELALQLSRGSR